MARRTSSSEREVRNAIAVVLAQAVFSSDETGFVDSSNDHITLIERVASGIPRPSGQLCCLVANG